MIKLTALYVARNGRSFQVKIAQAEAGNIQFDFLRPSHSLHRLFLRLVDQYALVLLPDETVHSRIRATKDRFGLMDEIAKGRLEHARYIEAQRRREEADSTMQNEAYSRINWNDFVIVETIEVGAADLLIELPKPLDLGMIMSMTVLQRQELWAGNLVAEPAGLKRPADEEPLEAGAPKRATVVAPSGIGETVPVRHDYTPKAAQGALHAADPMVICSICSRPVPSSQLQEHMRVELLDPKWADQRRAYLAKHTDTNMVDSATDVSRNLAAFSRGGPSHADKHARLNQTTVWDGNDASAGAANREASIRSRGIVQQQIAELQQRGDLSMDPSSGIGPHVPQQPAQYPYPYYQYPPGYPQAPGYPAPHPGYPGQQAYPYPPHQGYPGYPYPPQPGQPYPGILQQPSQPYPYPGYPYHPPPPQQPPPK